jgi:nickel-dependent lactate racemase
MMGVKYKTGINKDGETDGTWHRFLVIVTDGVDTHSKSTLKAAQDKLSSAGMENFNVVLIAAGTHACL